MDSFEDLENIITIPSKDIVTSILPIFINDRYTIFNVPESPYTYIAQEDFMESIIEKNNDKIPLTISSISISMKNISRLYKNVKNIENNSIKISSTVPKTPIDFIYQGYSDKYQKLSLYSKEKKTLNLDVNINIPEEKKTLNLDVNINISSKKKLEDYMIYTGIYTKAERLLKIKNFRLKKRNFKNEIIYKCRSNFAKKRQRKCGRFIPIH